MTLEEIQKIVSKQAADDGIWFCAITASEEYLQKQIRKLHYAIEEYIAEVGKRNDHQR